MASLIIRESFLGFASPVMYILFEETDSGTNEQVLNVLKRVTTVWIVLCSVDADDTQADRGQSDT